MKDPLFTTCTTHTVEEMLKSVRLEPALAIARLRREVIIDRRRRRDGVIPHLESLGQRPSAVGLTYIGDWGSEYTYKPRSSRPDWLLIDWDTILTLHTDLFQYNFHSLPILGWLLGYEPIARRALWLAHTLERELVTEVGRVWVADWSLRKYTPLEAWESKTKRSLTARILRSLHIQDAMRSTFRHYFRPVSTNVHHLRPKTRDLLGRVYRGDPDWARRVSILSLRDAGSVRKQCRGPLEMTGITEEGFFDFPTRRIDPFAYELAYMYRCINPKQQGAWVINEASQYGGEPNRYLVVHMGLYADYRTRKGGEFFTVLRQRKRLDRRPMSSLGPVFVDDFVKKYPRMFAWNMHNKLEKAKLDRAFNRDTSHDDLWVVRLDELRGYLEQRRRLEVMRTKGHPELPRQRGSRPMPKPFLVESPPFPTLGGRSLMVWVVHWYGKKYYRPQWEFPDDVIYKSAKKSPKNLKPGVLVHEDHFFVTLAVLKRMSTGDFHHSPEAMQWLENINVATEMRRRELEQRAKLLQREKFPQFYGDTAVRVPYNNHEDELIKKHYRPNMTEQDIEDLKRKLPGRTWLAIGRRANELCKEMIAAGIWNPERLPHRRMTQRMYKRIQQQIARHGGFPMLKDGKPILVEGEKNKTKEGS